MNSNSRDRVEVEGAPDVDDQMFQAARHRRKRSMIVGASLAAVVLGAGGFFGLRAASRSAEVELAKTWGRVATCLGTTPGATPERAWRRVRDAQLVAMGLPESARGAAGQKPWPQRCASYAYSVSETLRSNGSKQPLADSAKALGRALEGAESVSADLSAVVSRAFADAASAKIKAKVASDVPKPPAPAKPLDQDGLAKLHPLLPGMVQLQRIKTEPTPSGTLRFLIDDSDQPKVPALCQLEPASKRITCKSLPENLKKLSPGLMLWGTTEPGAETFIFAGERGKSGIFRSSDGKRVAEGLTYGAYSRKDGMLLRTIWNDRTKEVWYSVTPREGKPREKKLLSYDQVGNPYYNSGFFWDELVYKAWDKNHDNIDLYVRKVSANGELGPLQGVGEIGEPSLVEENDVPHIAACRSGRNLVLRVKGTDHQYVAFYDGQRWNPPVQADGTRGELTCRGNEVAITELTKNASAAGTGRYWPDVLSVHCTPAACTSKRLSFKKMLESEMELAPVDKSFITAAELDGKILVIWGGGARGGLRMRLGPIERLAKTPDRVIYDDLVEDNKATTTSTLIGARLISTGHKALLLLSTGKGVFAFLIDANGKLSPVTTVTS